MLHLPVVENRIAQFAARFEPVAGGGWAWHGDRALGGLPVTDAEYQTLVAAHARVLRLSDRLMLLWVAVAVVGLLGLELGGGIALDRWQQALVFVAPLPLVFWQVWRAERAPSMLAGRRVPVAPSRTARAAMGSRVRALPPSIAWMLVGTGVLLIVQLVRLGQVIRSPGYLVVAIGAIALGGTVFAVRLRR